MKVLVGDDYVLGEILASVARGLEGRGVGVVRYPTRPDEDPRRFPPELLKSCLRDVAVIVVSSRTMVDGAVFAAAPALKAVVFPSIGFNSCDVAAASSAGVKVVNGVTAENYESMAEATVMLMSALSLEINRKQQWFRENRSNPKPSEFTSRMLKGKVIGLIGFGRIAQEVVQRLRGWGPRAILACTRRPPPEPRDDVRFVDLPTLLEQSDIVSVHCPLTPQTRRLLDGPALARMKKGAIIVNTSRGGIIDEDALCQALASGHLAAAAIDTFEVEPVPVTHALRTMENVMLTHHNAGHTRELFDSLSLNAINNVMSILAGSMPADVVNRTQLMAAGFID